MRVVRAVFILFFVGSGVGFAQRQEAGRAAPIQANYRPYGYRVFTDWQPSNLRVDISPDDAAVFVDKHFAGLANQFSGTFKHLTLHAGPHLIEIRKAGFRSLAVEVSLFPDQNLTLWRTLQPVHDGEDADAEASAPAFEEGAFPPVVQGASGELRFDVTPKETEIYADGFYVGIVDDFNGSQHMMLTQGEHRLVLKREGYETLDFNLSVDSDRTVTYRGVLKKAAR